MKSIALIHAKKGNFDNAIEMFTEVLKIKCSEVGHIHPEVAGAHKRIGNVHYQRGDLKSATVEYRKALSIYQQSIGDDHHATKSALLIVEKVTKEIADALTPQAEIVDAQASQTPPIVSSDGAQDTHLSSSPNTCFFKRAPKGYESL